MEITLERFQALLDALERGEVRVAEKIDGVWKVHPEVKQTILAGFRLGAVRDMHEGQFSFFDKETFPVRSFNASDGVRIVPGGDKFFGPGSEGHVRICLATSHEILAEGLNRLEAGLRKVCGKA